MVLTANGLAGSLPPSIGALSALQSLQLGGNAVGGAIPDSVGSLTALTSLCAPTSHL